MGGYLNSAQERREVTGTGKAAFLSKPGVGLPPSRRDAGPNPVMAVVGCHLRHSSNFRLATIAARVVRHRTFGLREWNRDLDACADCEAGPSL